MGITMEDIGEKYALIGKILKGERKLQSPMDAYVFAVFWATLGLIPAVVYTLFAYVITPVPFNDDSFARTGDLPEPFAGLTNISFWSCSFGLIMMHNFPGKALPQQTVLSALLFCLLASGSMAYHIHGTVGGNLMANLWHALDDLGMYALFSTLSFISIHGAYHAVTNTTCGHECVAQKITTLLVFVAFTLTICLVNIFDYFAFVFFGAVIVVCDFIICWYDEDKWRGIASATMFLVSLALALLVQHLTQMKFVKDVRNDLWCPDHKTIPKCSCEWGGSTLDLSDSQKADYERRYGQYDMMHGFWHFTVSIPLTEMVLTASLAQGWGRSNVKRVNVTLFVMIMVLFVIILSMQAADVGPVAYITLVVPYSLLLLMVSTWFVLDSYQKQDKAAGAVELVPRQEHAVENSVVPSADDDTRVPPVVP
jgi:hypothetical protein